LIRFLVEPLEESLGIMGADLSAVFTGEKKKKKKVKGERFYKPPDKRLKERFDPEENLNFTSQLDAAIDKVCISPTYCH